MKLYLVQLVVLILFILDDGNCGLLSWFTRSHLEKRDVAQGRRHTPCVSQVSCNCTDGSVSVGDINQAACPKGTHIDLKSCSCPEGFSAQGLKSLPGRGHGKICSTPAGTESLAAVCKCSDGFTFADLTLDLCQGAGILNCACLT